MPCLSIISVHSLLLIMLFSKKVDSSESDISAVTLLPWMTLVGVQVHNGVWPPDNTILSFTGTLKSFDHVKLCISKKGANILRMHYFEYNLSKSKMSFVYTHCPSVCFSFHCALPFRLMFLFLNKNLTLSCGAKI